MRFTEIERKASEHLRLAPAMHRNIIPAEVKLARPKRTVSLDPILQNVSNNGLQGLLQFWKTVAQQEAQIDALGVVVQFSLVNGQARRFGKRFRETILIKEIS